MIYPLHQKVSLEDFAADCGGKIAKASDNIYFDSIITDSREKCASAIFVCIKGERFDGHDYASVAAEGGAISLMCERELDVSLPQIIVDNCVLALGRAAKAKRDRINPTVIALTGSVGKTTTRQLTASIFSHHTETVCTEGNLNNELGLPLTVLGIKSSTKALVLEMGMTGLGEISYLSKIASPDAGIITNIGSSHLEHLKTRENICKAKMEIADGMNGGALVLNGDEPLLQNVDGAYYVSKNNSNAFCHIGKVAFDESGSVFDLVIDGKTFSDLAVPAVGHHVVFDAALASTAAYLSGVSEESIRLGLKSFQNTGMRQHISTIKVGQKSITVIEDCYNAAPESVRASLDVLKSVKCKRRIAVLGDMRELGTDSPSLHRSVGEYALNCGIDALFTFGPLSEDIAQGAEDITVCSLTDLSDPSSLAKEITDYLNDGDCILFKASRAVEMERIVKLLSK